MLSSRGVARALVHDNVDVARRHRALLTTGDVLRPGVFGVHRLRVRLAVFGKLVRHDDLVAGGRGRGRSWRPGLGGRAQRGWTTSTRPRACVAHENRARAHEEAGTWAVLPDRRADAARLHLRDLGRLRARPRRRTARRRRTTCTIRIVSLLVLVHIVIALHDSPDVVFLLLSLLLLEILDVLHFLLGSHEHRGVLGFLHLPLQRRFHLFIAKLVLHLQRDFRIVDPLRQQIMTL
mmetsp:Transcript_14420/g.36025  ORF Transcript_14420/g.36025 Transcript_14420/m.36025 type:complete len:235 (-) Transcript_14420:2625-3329(-)